MSSSIDISYCIEEIWDLHRTGRVVTPPGSPNPIWTFHPKKCQVCGEGFDKDELVVGKHDEIIDEYIHIHCFIQAKMAVHDVEWKQFMHIINEIEAGKIKNSDFRELDR